MYSVAGLGDLVKGLQDSEKSARAAQQVYMSCVADPLHDGGMSPALELVSFQEQWYSAVGTIGKDMGAAAELFDAWRISLDRADG